MQEDKYIYERDRGIDLLQEQNHDCVVMKL